MPFWVRGLSWREESQSVSAPVVDGRTGALAGEPPKSLVFTLSDSHLSHVLLFTFESSQGALWRKKTTNESFTFLLGSGIGGDLMALYEELWAYMC